MKLVVKLSGPLYSEIKADLARPHQFAFERVGFVHGRLTDGASCKLLLLTTYHAVPDSHYIDDASVGARIGPDSVAWAMRAAYRGRATGEGLFHVHVHAHRGEPMMSATDARELPALVPGLQAVSRDCAHGIIILSDDHGASWVWLPYATEATRVDALNVVGVPLQVFLRGRSLE